MRLTILFAFIFSTDCFYSFGQHRFTSEIFDEVKRETLTYFEKEDEILKLDIFYPKEDTVGDRSLLLYVHGGGFAGGERDHPNHIRFCENMAKRGFVAVTISYTLEMKGKSFGCNRPAPDKIRTFLLTARDINRATAFLVGQAQRYSFDPENIVLLGSSAGAEAVLHAAYWKETYKDESGEILPVDFKYGGVVSMAGAITNLNWITSSSAIPTYLFHGTCDNLVPYGTAPHHYCQPQDRGYLVLHGAYPIAEKLRKLGKSYLLVTGCYGRHEWNDKPIKEFQAKIANYIYWERYLEASFQTHEIYRGEDSPCTEYNNFNFCAK